MVFLCSISAGQAGPTSSLSANFPSITMPFMAEDAHGKTTGTVTSPDLLVLDKQKHQQTILSVRTAKDLPLRLGVLIDTSGSARDSDLYAPAIKATFDFLKQALSGSNDKAFLMQFEDEAEATKFVSKDEISNLKVNLVTRGGTALYDAVVSACMGRMKSDPVQPARRALLILSDGDDNVSRMTRNQAIAAAQQTGTMIFAINTRELINNEKGRKNLERIAGPTGGLVGQAIGRNALQDVFAVLGSMLDNMQSVTFVPSEPTRKGEFRPIELKIATNGKLKVRAPDGYYGTESTPPAP